MSWKPNGETDAFAMIGHMRLARRNSLAGAGLGPAKGDVGLNVAHSIVTFRLTLGE